MTTTFKEFLTEAKIKAWSEDNLSTDVAIKTLNTHCKDGLKAIANGGLLWRGLSSKIKTVDKQFRLIDTAGSIRTSRDYDSSYHALLDASEYTAGLPSRTSSLICSSNYQVAYGYSGVELPVCVVPFDGTTVAVSNTKDFGANGNVDRKFARSIGIPESAFSVLDISPFLDTVSKTVGESGEHIDHKRIDAGMAKLSPDDLTLRWLFSILKGNVTKNFFSKTHDKDLKKYGGYIVALPKKAPPISHSLNKLVNASVWNEEKKFGFNGGIRSTYADHYDVFRQLIKSGDAKFTDSALTFYNLMKEAPVNARFSYLASKLVTADATKITAVKYGTALPKNAECWVSGKIMLIGAELLSDMLVQLAKQGHQIDTSRLPKFIKARITKALKDAQ